MGKSEKIYNVTLNEVLKLNLDSYHTIFLTNMVLRKMKHPEDKVDVIAGKVMKDMPDLCDKKNIVQISKRKCLENLEAAIEGSNTVPTEWLTGQTVSQVVKGLAKRVISKF